MPATVRYDEQFCPIARALDVLGDRWTLLILRELVMRDQRFSELRRHLPGIAATVLTQRLRTMEEQGLLTATESADGKSTYRATERGRSTVDVMRALFRWGLPLLGDPPPGAVRPWAAMNAVAISYDAAAAEGIDERYRLCIDGEDFLLSSVRGGGANRDDVDLEIASDAPFWFELRQGHTTLRDAIDTGRVRVTGTKRALGHFERVYQLR